MTFELVSRTISWVSEAELLARGVLYQSKQLIESPG